MDEKWSGTSGKFLAITQSALGKTGEISTEFVLRQSILMLWKSAEKWIERGSTARLDISYMMMYMMYMMMYKPFPSLLVPST